VDEEGRKEGRTEILEGRLRPKQRIIRKEGRKEVDLRRPTEAETMYYRERRKKGRKEGRKEGRKDGEFRRPTETETMHYKKGREEGRKEILGGQLKPKKAI